MMTPLTPLYAHGVLPCSCDSSMLMRLSRAHEVLQAHGDNDRGGRIAMQNGVHPEQNKRTELTMNRGDRADEEPKAEH